MGNMARADLFVSIHLNADPDQDSPEDLEASGQEIWIYPGANRSRATAESISASLKKAFPEEVFRGVKEADLGVLRMTTMRAVLIEVGFVDNRKTAAQLSLPAVQLRLAKAIVGGTV